MSSAEHDVLQSLLDRLALLESALDEDMRWLGLAPQSLAAFAALESHQRSASRAVLKSFEQVEDQLARVFRLLPKMLGVETDRWFARDFADWMEKFEVLESAATWSSIVKLRNQLVHDYPVDQATQFDRLRQVFDFIPEMKRTRRALMAFVDARIRRTGL